MKKDSTKREKQKGKIQVQAEKETT